MPDIYVSDESPSAGSGQSPSAGSKSRKSSRKSKSNSLTSSGSKKKTAKQETVVERLENHRSEGGLKSFQIKPRRVKFETQEKKEEVLILLRRHWLTNVGWVVITFVAILAPLILKAVPLLSFLPLRFKIMTIVMWYLIVVAFVFEKFLAWYFNVNIITDERIIDVDFYSLGYKEVSEAKIDKVQDVGYVTSGAVRSLFNFGDVLIQTAGEVTQLVFSAIPNPSQVVKVLNELILEEEQEKIEGKVR